MDYFEKALRMHEENRGKIEVTSKIPVRDREALSTAYTPGVAQPCREIARNQEDVYRYTAKGNLVAVVSDGSAVLGLGNIGPEAAMPVMEGKAILFKEFADIDAFPICLKTQDTEEIIQTVKNLEPTFGGINLEDIAAPRCFEIEKRLQEQMNIPVFHDDQHGTAIVLSAALLNALKVAGKRIEEVRIVVNGAGSAGTAIIRMLIALGAVNVTACDQAGILHKGLGERITDAQRELCEITNPENRQGSLADAMAGADVFIGVSAPNIVTKEMVSSMEERSIVFPMANPTPEIMPDLAREAGAYVVGTGRSDFPNQINNVLAFPGVFRGALDARAKRITEGMKVAACHAIADVIPEEELGRENIIPNAFDPRVVTAVARAVREAWMQEEGQR